MASPKDQYACAHICVEVDLEAGLLEAIKLTVGNWFHFQKLDYEQLPFKCRGCQEYGHFICNCPKKPEIQQDKAEGWHRVNRAKSKLQADVASKEATVIPIEGSQETSKTKEINDVRNETNDVEEKSSNEVSKEPEVALSDQQGKDHDEGTTTTKEGESMEQSEEDTESEEEEEEEGEQN